MSEPVRAVTCWPVLWYVASAPVELPWHFPPGRWSRRRCGADRIGRARRGRQVYVLPVLRDAERERLCVWRVRSRLPERFGQLCRVLVRGAMNSALVEFGDGFQVVTSRNYLRRWQP